MPKDGGDKAYETLYFFHLFLSGTLMGTGVKGRFTEMVTFELCPEE